MNRFWLWPELDGNGERFVFTSSQPTLPSGIDQNAESFQVFTAPMWIYDGQNYSGTAVRLLNVGGCNNLATCPAGVGNWLNRIRSFHFGAERLGENEVVIAGEARIPNISLSE